MSATERCPHCGRPMAVRGPVDQAVVDAADAFGVEVWRVRNGSNGGDRHVSVTRARQVAMWIMRNRLSFSYPEIGREFNQRDHSSAMVAVKRVQNSPPLLAIAEKLSAILDDTHPKLDVTTRLAAMEQRIAELESMLRKEAAE